MTRWDRFCAGELPFEIVIAMAATAGPIVAGYRYATVAPKSPVLATSMFGAAGFALVALIWRAFLRNRKAQNANELHALDGVLHSLHAILTAGTTEISLRICVFVPGKEPDKCHQITNYVGVEIPNGRGRDLPRRCGVVGTAFRMGVVQYAKLPKNTNVTDYLVNVHGFERDEISPTQLDRKSWSGIPVGDPGNVVAVIYLDSDKQEFFGKRNHPRRKTLDAATIGVAKFISRT